MYCIYIFLGAAGIMSVVLRGIMSVAAWYLPHVPGTKYDIDSHPSMAMIRAVNCKYKFKYLCTNIDNRPWHGNGILLLTFFAIFKNMPINRL